MTWKEGESRLKGVQANVARIQCYKGMQEYFDKDEVDILLTKAMIWLNPWLGEYGLGFDRPIAVITENKNTEISSCMSVFSQYRSGAGRILPDSAMF